MTLHEIRVFETNENRLKLHVFVTNSIVTNNILSSKGCRQKPPGDEIYFSSPIVPFDDEIFLHRRLFC